MESLLSFWCFDGVRNAVDRRRDRSKLSKVIRTKQGIAIGD